MKTIIKKILISLIFTGVTFHSTKAQVVVIERLPGTSTSCTRPPDPIISSISNSFACSGDTLSINGQNLGLTSEVFFGVIKAILLSKSSTLLRVIVPDNVNGANIGIIYGRLQPNFPFGFLNCFYKASTTFSVRGTSPILSSGSSLSRCTGQSISINGNNLLNVRKVKLGGIDAIFTVVSNNLINVVVPSNAISGSIAVTNGCGTSTLNGFIFLGSDALDIRSVFPEQVCKGAGINVIGSNLSSVTTVSVDGINTEFSKDDGTLKVKIPVNASAGILSISNQCSTVSYSKSVIDKTAPSRPIFVDGLNLCPGKNFIINNVENSLADVFLTKILTTITTKAEILSRDGNIANILIPNNLSSGTYVVQVSDNCGNLSGYSISSVKINSNPIIEGLNFTNRCVGETLTINGTNFQGVTNVTLGGVSVSYNVINNNSISVSVPSTAKSGEVVVTNPCGSSKIAGFIFRGTAPVIVSLSKTSTCPRETILIRGANLSGAKVNIGQAPATILSNTGTEINVVVPSPIDPNNLLEVITTCGSDTEPFKVKGGPVINFITPAFQCANNTISISGSNFDGTSKVTIGGVSVPFSVNIGGAVIIANITPAVKSGDIVVTSNCGSATFLGFRMILPPTITGFTPVSACIGQVITVTGTNFEGGDGLQVKVGGAFANYTRKSSTSLSVTVPPGAVSGNIEVTSNIYISPNTCGGTASQAGFKLLKKPRIETINPLSSCAGQRITISGSEFSEVTSVSIGGVNTTFNLVNNTLQVTAPERVSSGKIVVGNVCESDERDGFTLLSAPFLEGFSPQSACANKDIILLGNHLGNVSSIEIAGKTVNFKVLSTNSVSINVPPGTNSGDIRVTNACGSTSIGGFVFTGVPPVIQSLSKSSACSGETVVIRGVNLGGATVRIWNIPAQVVSNTGTEITVNVPLVEDAGELVLLVTTACGSDKKPFEVKGRLPVISGANNLSRCAGQELTISGSNFNGVSKVTIGGVGVDYRIVSGNSIVVVVSAAARSGEIGVTNGCGTTVLRGFVFTGVPPVIQSLSKSSACSGETVVIRGVNLGGATVRIWNIPAQVVSNTSTEITVNVPLVEDAGELVLLVTTACGSDKKPFEVKGRLPVISGANPLSACAGAVLTISGNHLSSVNKVTLGGVNVPFNIINNITLTVKVPVDAQTGDIKVENNCGTAALKGFVLIGDAPVINDFFPKNGCVGEEIIITGKNFGGPPSNPAIWTHPLNPSVHDTVTIYFDASKGSGGLANCNCTVYLHTGLITATSKGPTDWKYVKTQWGVNNPKWAMTRVNGRPNLYKFVLNSSILSYYGASITDTILNLAFVLRDADGKREGKDTGGGDLFISVLNDSNQIFSTLNPQLFIGKREVEIIYNSGDTMIAIAPEIQGSGAVEIITNCGMSRHRQEFTRRPFSEKMNAGLDLEICNSISTEVKLNGSLTNSGDLALWRLIPGRGDTVSFSSASDPKAIVSSMRAASDGYLFLVWSNEKGCFRSELDRRDSVAIRLFSPPSPAKINFPSSPALCNATVTELKAQPVFTGIGTWQVITGPGRIDVNNQPETRLVGLIPGLNTRIRWKVENGVCPSVIHEINLINSIANPPAEGGQDRTVCSSLPSLRLDATVRGGQVGRWSLLPGFGTATFRNTNDPKTEIFQMVPNENGELILKWEVFGSGCFLKPNDNVDFVRINFDFPPQATILSKDTVLCQGADYELKASSNFIGFGKWSILSDNGKIQNPNNSKTTITGLSPGKIGVTWSVKSGECPEVKDTLNVQVDERPVAFAGNPQMFCAQREARLNAQAPLVGSGKWEVKPLSVGLENFSLPDTRIFNLPDSGKIELVWIVQNGVCPDARSETYLLNYLEPSAADAGEDAVYCENSPVQLAAVKPKIGIGRWSVISASASVVNETETSSSVVGLIGGSTGIFRWTVRNGICPEKIDDVNIKVDHLPSLAFAGRDTTLCGQDTFRLEALAPLLGEGSWRILNGNIRLDDSKLHNTRLTGIQEGISTKMIWEIRNGVCPVSRDSIEITGQNIGPEVSPGFLIRDTFCVSDSVKVIEISGLGDSQFAQNASFRWDFGDGNFSLVRDPVHRFRYPGSYRIQLKVNMGFCRSFEITKSVFVKSAVCSTPRDFVNRSKSRINPFVSLSSFPNPTSGTFSVEAVLSQPTSIKIRIISPEGRLLEIRERYGISELTENFNLNHSGFFIIEVVAEGISRHFRMFGISP